MAPGHLISEGSLRDENEKHPVDEPEPDSQVTKNPFPATMTVPGVDGQPVTLELAVVDGVVYAPRLDDARLDPQIRQYVTNYCAAWSGSMVTAGQLEQQWPVTPPRHAQIAFRESSLYAMLGLKHDERLLRIDVDNVKNELRFVVESPRLAPMPYWDGGPPHVSLPIAAYYEQPQAGQ
jgi:hypothetical protein